jgi:hypothetical protein
MILASLESQQRALQLYVEKHHSTNKEDKTKWWKVWPLYKRRTGKTSNHQKRNNWFMRNLFFDEIELIMEITTSSRTKPKHTSQFHLNPWNFSPIGIHCQNGWKNLEGQYSESSSKTVCISKRNKWKHMHIYKGKYLKETKLYKEPNIERLKTK